MSDKWVIFVQCEKKWLCFRTRFARCARNRWWAQTFHRQLHTVPWSRVEQLVFIIDKRMCHYARVTCPFIFSFDTSDHNRIVIGSFLAVQSKVPPCPTGMCYVSPFELSLYFFVASSSAGGHNHDSVWQSATHRLTTKPDSTSWFAVRQESIRVRKPNVHSFARKTTRTAPTTLPSL